jgi:hypothetical protein
VTRPVEALGQLCGRVDDRLEALGDHGDRG